MKLTVLMDNHTYIDQYYLAEPAVCYYIEDEGRKMLFDLAYSDAYIANAQAMDIDLGSVDTLVFSHGHIDHTLGFRDFDERFGKGQKVIAHALCFNEKRFDGEAIGSPLDTEYVMNNYDAELTVQPVNITEKLVFLGQIPVSNPFEARRSIGEIKIGDEWKEDEILEDTALAYRTDAGLFIITGCSHAGICNIINYAKQVCGDERIIGVLGGFHLFEEDEKNP